MIRPVRATGPRPMPRANYPVLADHRSRFRAGSNPVCESVPVGTGLLILGKVTGFGPVAALIYSLPQLLEATSRSQT